MEHMMKEATVSIMFATVTAAYVSCKTCSKPTTRTKDVSSCCHMSGRFERQEEAPKKN